MKLVINPTEARTAPLFLPSMHSRKSSSDSRLSWSGLVKHTSSSTREIPSAISPAPGLQKQPPRTETPARRPRVASVAVLPFADLSPARDQDYFCEGIAEELLGALSMVDDLRVAARGSSFQLKGQALDSRDVGKALGVATLLEGSVRKAGNRVRISARLVNASDRRQIWAETFDRTLDDIFAIQEEIAQAVVRALELRLSVARQGRITRVGTRDAQAYELYLRGRKFLMLHGEPALRVAADDVPMTVDEPRDRSQVLGVDHLDALGSGDLGTDAGDPAVLHEQRDALLGRHREGIAGGGFHS